MEICCEKNCVCIAEPKKMFCAIHAAGYKFHDGATEKRCANCRREIVKGESYQRRDDGEYHTKACKTHREVAAEREKATATA